jgi:hypothetical protein
MIGNDVLRMQLERQAHRLLMTLSDVKSGRSWGPVPLLELEVYSKAERIAGTRPLDTGSVFRVIGMGGANGTNWIAWYGTTNGGVTTPFAVERGTNLASAPEVVVSNLMRAASGTNMGALEIHL